jgi:hypothetical protein
MSKKLEAIKRILKEHDVRDPRGALQAIEGVLSTKSEGVKPILKLEVIDYGDRGEVHIKSHKQIEPKHVGLAIDGLRELAVKKNKECRECEGKPPVKELLEHLFAQFEADLQKKGAN